MRRPRSVADDSSFGRSGIRAGRGAVLLAVAVLLGVVLLNAADNPPPDRTAAGRPDTTPSNVTTSTGVTTTVVTLPPRAPADVKVITANGTDVKGVARKATDQLKAAGYNVLSPTDAQKVTASAVYFVGDYMREAEAVAASLALPPTSAVALPTPPPLADVRGANVVVVVGPELAQRLAGTTSTTSATTVAGATTSSTTARTPSSTSTTKP